jgi:Mor family transcriptional regulator
MGTDRVRLMTAKPQVIDALLVIEEEARAVAQFFGVDNFDVAAQMLVRRVSGRIGGQKVYVRGAREARKERDELIRARYTGGNLEELATEFYLDARQVRRIVARQAQRVETVGAKTT